MKNCVYRKAKLIILMIMLSGCASVKKEELTFNGMIFNDKNEAVSDVSIYLNDNEITVSDIYGHFTINKLENYKEYEIKAVKKGYETTVIDFSLLNASQVLYLRMYSADELLSKAEKFISEKKYDEANNALIRAEKAEASYLRVNYLKAVLYYTKKDYENALFVMNDLMEKEYSDSYIYLFMADIYEKGFDNLEETKKYLEKFLKAEFSEEVSDRLMRLNNKE